jgi:Flp pilus assembly protein TadD
MGLIAEKTAQHADDWNRAAVDFAQLVAIQPSDVGYLLLARALQQAGRPDEANLAYQRARELSADIAQAQQTATRLAAQ